MIYPVLIGLRMSATGKSYTDFSKFCILLSKLYLVENRRKNLLLPMKKYSVSIKLSTIKNNSHMNLRTSHAQLSEKAASIKRKTTKIKFCHKKSTLPVKK